jgi:hypothetical protein
LCRVEPDQNLRNFIDLDAALLLQLIVVLGSAHEKFAVLTGPKKKNVVHESEQTTKKTTENV